MFSGKVFLCSLERKEGFQKYIIQKFMRNGREGFGRAINHSSYVLGKKLGLGWY
jgi:hypothetical protein